MPCNFLEMYYIFLYLLLGYLYDLRFLNDWRPIMTEWKEDKPIQTSNEEREIFSWDESNVLL